MSLPKELRDQLLSGYLDDALTADERSRVEQMLNSDTDLADELAQLRGLRQSLKAISEADSDIKLDGGFADRVLGAAVARAQAEGYADDHPLVRLVEHPSTSRPPESGSSTWRYAGLLVGLAASIVIAVVALRPAQDPGLVVAEAETQPAPQEDPLSAPGSVMEAPKLADSDVTDPVIPAKDDPMVEPPSTPSPTQQLEPPQPKEAIAQMPPRTDSVEPPSVTEILVPDTVNGAVLVLEVRRTAAGRQSGAVANAMRLASISPTSEKQITDEIAGFVDKQQPLDEQASVLYLQAPAKSLDSFYLHLLDDQEGIESVGLTIAFDAPIMQVVNVLHSDPTLVRHDTSLELMSENGVVEHFVSRLEQLPYQPLNREMVRAIPSRGPDIPAQILVLVR